MSSTTKVITPVATLSYPHLLEPAKGPSNNGDEKYSASLVFPTGTDLKALEAAVLAAAEAKWGTKSVEMIRKGQLKLPFRKDAEAKGYAEGSVFLNVRTKSKPVVVFSYPDPATGKPQIMSDEDVKKHMYPGAQVRASLSAFAYDTSGNKGISFGLNNMQKVGDGERIDGRAKAEDEFEVDLNAAPAALESFI